MGYIIMAERPDGGLVAFEPDECIEYVLFDDGQTVRSLFHRRSKQKVDHPWILRERHWGRYATSCGRPGMPVLLDGPARVVPAAEAAGRFRAAGLALPLSLARAIGRAERKP